MQTIYGNYKIDANGNIYSRRGLLKLKIDKNHYRVNINQHWVSYARVVATYLLVNENNYDRLIFLDRNPLNCSIDNLKWVSEKEYQKYIYHAQIQNKIIDKKIAINKCKCPKIRQYYISENIDIVNKEFLLISKEITVSFWKEIMGYVYIKIIEKLQRFSLLYDLKTYVISRLHFYKKVYL